MKPPDRHFWHGRRVLLTGHTGFKGAWLALMLRQLGAEVIGLALPPEPGPSLFTLLAPALAVQHHVIDLRDAPAIAALTRAAQPSIVLHLAAQALVPQSYADPAGTFACNLDGTINLLQAMRDQPGIAAAVLVTTDKVYRNDASGRRFVETDPLGGKDPYSASKAAAELAVACWRASYGTSLPPMATARAGNVVGGGDFAATRLVPDIVRAIDPGTALALRYPHATRPWQHVLDVLTGYLLLAEHLAEHGTATAPAMNFAPAEADEVTVLDIIAAFAENFATPLPWRQVENPPPEAPRLALDPSLANTTLGWHPRHNRTAMIAATASWYAAWHHGADMIARCRHDVSEALASAGAR